MDAALEAGAEDLTLNEDGSVDVETSWEEFLNVKDALIKAGFESAHADVTMIADTTVIMDKEGAEKLLGLIDALEDLDDVQNVYTNAEITSETLAQLDE
jgi:transcriptional/translational regulatory protein YebC/TACO1